MPAGAVDGLRERYGDGGSTGAVERLLDRPNSAPPYPISIHLWGPLSKLIDNPADVTRSMDDPKYLHRALSDPIENEIIGIRSTPDLASGTVHQEGITFRLLEQGGAEAFQRRDETQGLPTAVSRDVIANLVEVAPRRRREGKFHHSLGVCSP